MPTMLHNTKVQCSASGGAGAESWGCMHPAKDAQYDTQMYMSHWGTKFRAVISAPHTRSGRRTGVKPCKYFAVIQSASE